MRGLVEALFIKNMLRQQGHEVHIKLHTDSAAAIGHCSRLGNGKRMRHLEGAELWIQQIIRSGLASIVKINGKLNPADLFTKYLSRSEIIFHMATLGYELLDGNDQVLGCKDIQMSDESYFDSATEEEADEMQAANDKLDEVLRSHATKLGRGLEG